MSNKENAGRVPDELVNQIICGDCVKLMADLLPDNCIDLTVTSPPYDDIRSYKDHISYFNFEAIADQLCRVTAKGGVIVWVVGDQTKDGDESGTSFRQALHFKKLGMLLHDTMIYERRSQFPPNVRYWQEFEYMFVFSKGKPKTFHPLMVPKKASTMERQKYRFDTFSRGRDGKQIALSEAGHARMRAASEKTMRVRGNIWEYAVGKGGSSKDAIAFSHPAIFPEGLARDHILSWSDPGDLCFDPLCGSGTTLKQAKLLKRNYLGFEVVSDYVELSRRRLEATQSPLMVI